MNSSETQDICDHCHLSYPKNSLIEANFNGKKLKFCCKGCQGVYLFLHHQNLESFYDQLKDQAIKPPKEFSDKDLNVFDSQSFEDKFIKQNQDGFSQGYFIIDGIFCSACIDLLDRAINRLDGVYEANINHTNNKIKIVFDKTITPLSQIVLLVRKLGYEINVYDPKISENHNKKLSKSYFFSLVIAIFCTMNVMWVAVGQYTGYFFGSSQEMKDALNLASFLLSTPVLFYSGRFFYINAYHQIKNHNIGMDTLVITGASLTYLYSLFAAITRSGETYFEAVAMILTFVFIGKFLEMRAKRQAGDFFDKLGFMLPNQVTCIIDGVPTPQHPEDVKIGSIIEVAPHEIIAIDGKLISSEALLDTKTISGEAFPRLEKQGAKILSGSINTQKTFYYQTESLFSNSLLFCLVDTLENSLSKKPRIQNLATKLSRIFSKSVLLIALFGFLFWYFVFHAGFEKSLMIGISVIVISCPCALALATPIASIIGISEASKNQIIFKESRFLESIAKAKLVIFDKTGTLTEGSPKVVKTHLFENFDPLLLASLLSKSSHPIAKTILTFLDLKKFKPHPLSHIQEFLGKGISAINKNQTILGGSLEFLRENGVKVDFDPQDFIVFGFAKDSKLLAIYLLEDQLKQNAPEFITSLQKEGIKTILLSGDHKKSVATTAQKLHITEYHSNQLPQDKAKFIKNQNQYLKPHQSLIMVGDGINDSLALSQSSIGINFIDKNSQVSSFASDVILLNSKIQTLELSFKIAKRTYRIIKQNIALSLIYNLFMIPIALCGLVIPLFAAISMSLSSLLVIANSFRIKKN